MLAKIRGDVQPSDPTLVAELEELEAIVEKSRHSRNRVWNIAIGRHSGALHLGRRAWMGFFLMQMLMWSGIMAITTYSGELFKVAGFTASKSAWMGGFCNSLGGVVGTAAAVSFRALSSLSLLPTEILLPVYDWLTVFSLPGTCD